MIYMINYVKVNGKIYTPRYFPHIAIIKELGFLKFQSKHTINCKNIIFKRN